MIFLIFCHYLEMFEFVEKLYVVRFTQIKWSTYSSSTSKFKSNNFRQLRRHQISIFMRWQSVRKNEVDYLNI